MLEMQNSPTDHRSTESEFSIYQDPRSFTVTFKFDRLYAVPFCLSEYHYSYLLEISGPHYGGKERGRRKSVFPPGTLDNI